jgi:hypothetical protein
MKAALACLAKAATVADQQQQQQQDASAGVTTAAGQKAAPADASDAANGAASAARIAAGAACESGGCSGDPKRNESCGDGSGGSVAAVDIAQRKRMERATKSKRRKEDPGAAGTETPKKRMKNGLKKAAQAPGQTNLHAFTGSAAGKKKKASLSSPLSYICIYTYIYICMYMYIYIYTASACLLACLRVRVPD